MFKSFNIAPTIILLGTLVFTHHAIANECYEPSPNLDDDYYRLESTDTITDSEKKLLYQFFQNISGKWRGQLLQTECRGPDRAPRTIKKTARLTTKNSLNSQGELSIQVEKHFTAKRIKKLETVTLLGKRNIFNLDIRTQQLIFADKYRQINQVQPKADKTKPSSNNETIIDKSKEDAQKEIVTNYEKEERNKTSRLTEVIYDIELNTNQLTIARAYYTNGVYTGQERWTLRPN